MTRPKLTLLQKAFEKLHADLDRSRRGSTVKVDKDALRALLIDHGNLLAYHREVEEGA